MVVTMFPVEQRRGGGMEHGKGVPAPAFFVVHPMTAFDFAILFGPPRLAIAETNASLLDREGKGQGKFRASVTLECAHGERERLADGGEELQAGPVILAGGEPKNPIPRAVIEGGVLEACVARDLDLLDIDLDTVTGALLAVTRQLAGAALGRRRTGGEPRAWQMRRMVAAATRIQCTRSSQIRVRTAPNWRSRQACSINATVESAMRRARIGG